MNKVAIVDDAQLMRHLLHSFIDGKKNHVFESEKGQGAIDILKEERRYNHPLSRLGHARYGRFSSSRNHQCSQIQKTCP